MKSKLLIFTILITVIFGWDNICLAEGYQYHSEQGNYTITIPEGWEVIPQQVVEEYRLQVIEQAENQEALKDIYFDAAFQKCNSTGTYFKHPYVLMRVMDIGQPSESYLISLTGKSAKELNKIEQEAFPNITSSDLEEVQHYYSPDNHSVLIAQVTDFPPIGEVVLLAGGSAGRKGIVFTHFYCLKNNFDSEQADFHEIFNSFKYDAGFEYADIQNIPLPHKQDRVARTIAGTIPWVLVIILILNP